MSNKKRILIAGCGGSAGANFIKSLRMAEEDFYLVGCDFNKYHLELVEGLDKKYIIPPIKDPSFIDKLNQIISKEKIELVHPQPDVMVSIISKNRDKVKTKTFIPANDTVETCQNKMKLMDLLKKNNITIPKSFLIKNKNDLEVALKNLLKTNEKVWLRAIKGSGSKASLPINDVDQGDQWIKYWISMKGLKYENFMVSEFLPGKEFAFQSIWENGEVITSQARERMEYVFANQMPSGQSSSPAVAKTVHRDDVNEIAAKTIKTVDKNATGIFCVDIKENKQGIPCIIEINCGRFFTTNNFFSTAGSNMPYYYIKMAYGEELPNLSKYNAIPEGWYWIRIIDMGHKLVKGEKWESQII